jgi:SAM-dependent methyltransferase
MSQSVNTTLQAIAERLHEEGIFTGGPPQLFESAGRLQFSTLIREGLWPHSKVLDIGCGALRAGYWLVRFLEPERYYGIEPNRKMLDKGIEYVLTPECSAPNDRLSITMIASTCRSLAANSMYSWLDRSGRMPRSRRFKRCLTAFATSPNQERSS